MTNDSLFFGAHNFGAIACRELGLLHQNSTFNFALVDGRVTYAANMLLDDHCQDLNITTESLYHATDYPTLVPTFYFQGTEDGATVAPHAVKHFKFASAKNPKAELFLVSSEGHSPLNSRITDPTHAQRPQVLALLQNALQGESMGQTEWQSLVSSGEFPKWEWHRTTHAHP